MLMKLSLVDGRLWHEGRKHWCLRRYCTELHRLLSTGLIYTHTDTDIGINAAGVAEVVTPQYLTCRGRPVLTTPPPIFSQVFYFFPSAELLNTASRCHFHHTILRWKIHKFSGKGHSPSPGPTPRRLRRLDSRVFGARPATPNVPVALTPTHTDGQTYLIHTHRPDRQTDRETEIDRDTRTHTDDGYDWYIHPQKFSVYFYSDIYFTISTYCK